jgi:hypothetical protein
MPIIQRFQEHMQAKRLRDAVEALDEALALAEEAPLSS